MPPTVKPEKSPDQIIMEILPSETDRRALANLLIGFRKSKDAQWDDYRRKIAGPILKALEEIIVELNRSGFYGLSARHTMSGGMQFTWFQAVDNRIKKPIVPGELCDGCRRSCPRRDERGVFFDGVKRCWQKGGQDDGGSQRIPGAHRAG